MSLLQYIKHRSIRNNNTNNNSNNKNLRRAFNTFIYETFFYSHEKKVKIFFKIIVIKLIKCRAGKADEYNMKSTKGKKFTLSQKIMSRMKILIKRKYFLSLFFQKKKKEN